MTILLRGTKATRLGSQVALKHKGEESFLRLGIKAIIPF
jgi:hypothetical protein